jgi:SAM-dependent methyltransferase
MTGTDRPPVLNHQQEHWETMLSQKPEMFGSSPSDPARKAADVFRASGLRRVLELGGGQGRDTFFLAQSGFALDVLDYAAPGVEAMRRKARELGLSDQVNPAQHDVRRSLPFPDATFDACYSHMLFCMALTTAELDALSREIFRVLRPGGLCVYTVRNTNDPDFGRGIHRGEDLYENQGFIVHFFDRAKVERLAHGYEIVSVDEFEESKLPRRLFRVTLRKPSNEAWVSATRG